MGSVFLQIGIVTIMAALLGVVARVFRQPILLAYIVAGVLLGTSGLNVIHNPGLTQDIATIGIIFLLFLVGLELDVSKVKTLGRVVVVTSLVQMVLVGAAGYGLTHLLGYGNNEAFYLGLAVAFSSTAVVMKLLLDRKDLASLYGRVAIGILLLQDVVAILVLMLISGVGAGTLDPVVLVNFLVRGTLFLGGTWLVTKYVLGPLFYYIAKSTELLFLMSVAWAFLFAIVADQLGFSKEIGAFLAGLSLATLPYTLEIIGRVRPLKDFFLVIFFVVLGLQISWPVVEHNLVLILALSGLVVFGKSLLISVTMTRQGYPKRPAYLTGASLGQMSEFSLLVVLLGAQYGHLSQEFVALTATLLAVTIILNTYWNSLNRYLYPVLVWPLRFLGGKIRSKELRYRPQKMQGHILLFGANRMGYQMLKTLEAMKRNVLVIDHNPEVIRRLLRRGVACVYGDIDDLELLEEMGLADARMVISTVPNTSANLYMIEQTRQTNPEAFIIVTSDSIPDALDLYTAGADYVILPHLLGGEQASLLLEEVESQIVTPDVLRARRKNHIAHLSKRKIDLAT